MADARVTATKSESLDRISFELEYWRVRNLVIAIACLAREINEQPAENGFHSFNDPKTDAMVSLILDADKLVSSINYN